MLGLAIFGTILLGSAIRCGLDNMQSKSRTYGLTNKERMPISFDRKGRMCINGERCRTEYKTIGGETYSMEVGVNTGTIYKDSYEEELYSLLARNDIARIMAEEDGALAYYSVEPDWCKKWHKNFITREISTGKIIARLEAKMASGWNLDTETWIYKKYYISKNNPQFSTDEEDEGIKISKEEFIRLNIMGGSHQVTNMEINIKGYTTIPTMSVRGNCPTDFNITDEKLDYYIKKILKDERIPNFIRETFKDNEMYIKRIFQSKFRMGAD